MTNLAEKTSSSSAPPIADAQPRKSVSHQMYERFERRRLWRHSLAVFYVAIMIAYLAWRYTIINPHSLGLSVAYFAADCIGFLLGLAGIITTWNYSHREPPAAPEGLSVDIFVPTYKEPVHIIRRTALAAKAIDYPHGTVILDDGQRDDVKALALELGIGYLRRPENICAKAGNLNYGLARSRADFVMVFDADHIALPHALDVTLGFFRDEKVALVQTPQDYYNTDAFQYINSKRTGGLWHDQSCFYNCVQPSGDALNAATCVGTGVVYRRSALNDISGIPVETVTEDIHTSLKLHKAGYKCVFLNEPVAYGIAASDLGEYYKTRHRWAHGNLHAMAHENLLFCRGLTLAQRLQYFALHLYYLEGWQQLILFIVPLVALTFGLQPFTVTIFNVAVVMSFPFLSYILLQEMGCGFTRYWANEIFSVARWPIHLVSIAGLFGGKMAFRSSSKNIEGKLNWRLMAPQLAVLAAGLLATGIGIYRLHGNYTPGPLFRFIFGLIRDWHIPQINLEALLPAGYTVDLVAVAGFWALYGAARSAAFVRKARQDARNSHNFFRFRIPVPVILDEKNGGYGRTLYISEEGMRLTDMREGPHLAPGAVMTLSLAMPAGKVPVELAVDRVEGQEIEGRFIFDCDDQRDLLANGLYSVDWHREFLHRTAYFATPSEVLVNGLRLRWKGHREYGPWCAALFQKAGQLPMNSLYAIMANKMSNDALLSFICFQPLSAGEEVRGIALTETGPKPFQAVVEDYEPLSSLARTGLDGATVQRYRLRLVA